MIQYYTIPACVVLDLTGELGNLDDATLRSYT